MTSGFEVLATKVRSKRAGVLLGASLATSLSNALEYTVIP
jgi:hypothetical protein